MEKSTVQLKMTRPGWHSTTPPSVQSSYDNENMARSSRVMRLPDVAENSPRILLLTDYNSRSKCERSTKTGCTVRGIHTIDGGSRPLPVWYIFHVSPSLQLFMAVDHWLLTLWVQQACAAPEMQPLQKCIPCDNCAQYNVQRQ